MPLAARAGKATHLLAGQRRAAPSALRVGGFDHRVFPRHDTWTADVGLAPSASPDAFPAAPSRSLPAPRCETQRDRSPERSPLLASSFRPRTPSRAPRVIALASRRRRRTSSALTVFCCCATLGRTATRCALPPFYREMGKELARVSSRRGVAGGRERWAHTQAAFLTEAEFTGRRINR